MRRNGFVYFLALALVVACVWAPSLWASDVRTLVYAALAPNIGFAVGVFLME